MGAKGDPKRDVMPQLDDAAARVVAKFLASPDTGRKEYNTTPKRTAPKKLPKQKPAEAVTPVTAIDERLPGRRNPEDSVLSVTPSWQRACRWYEEPCAEPVYKQGLCKKHHRRAANQRKTNAAKERAKNRRI